MAKATIQEARSQAWTSMRVLRSFKIGELAATSAINVKDATSYARRLERAGYLRRVSSSRSKDSEMAFRLIRDTGPAAPVAWPEGGCYDLNRRCAYAAPATQLTSCEVSKRMSVTGFGASFASAELRRFIGHQVLLRHHESDENIVYVFDAHHNLICFAEKEAHSQSERPAFKYPIAESYYDEPPKPGDIITPHGIWRKASKPITKRRGGDA